jgi:hypothetical protein
MEEVRPGCYWRDRAEASVRGERGVSVAEIQRGVLGVVQGLASLTGSF